MSIHVAHLPTRSDHWNGRQATCLVHYRLVAEAEPDSLCRVLNLLAMQYLTPTALNVVRTDDLLHMELSVDGLSWHRAEVISNKMLNLVCVVSVELQAADHECLAAAG
ncbi:hypothetical protein [Pseudomonas sp.]|uniref:hypothetical protein n=1 Tax=Pseudomonas sp. TaxID=306 RepID=UPI003CC55CD1